MNGPFEYNLFRIIFQKQESFYNTILLERSNGLTREAPTKSQKCISWKIITKLI